MISQNGAASVLSEWLVLLICPFEIDVFRQYHQRFRPTVHLPLAPCRNWPIAEVAIPPSMINMQVAGQ